MNENPLKDIPIEKLKKYCMELGYSLVKRPTLRTTFNSCPVCGSIPENMTYLDGVLTECPNGCFKGELIARRIVTGGGVVKRSMSEARQLAMISWNDAVERWHNEEKKKNENEIEK